MTLRLRNPVSEGATIAFVGDFVPGFPGAPSIGKSRMLLDLLQACDMTVANLECPLTSAGSSKTRFSSLSASPASVSVIRDFRISLVSLANNHIMDRGRGGLDETLSVLDEQGIARIGAGRNIEEAFRPHFLHGPGPQVAFLAFSYESPNAPSTAGLGSAGANPLVMREAQNTIASLKRQGYLVCVSYHGGEEFFRIPSPTRRALFAELANSGADVVIGHHAHVFQGIEILNRSVLAYGLGNFLMTTPYQIAHKGTAVGLLLVIEFDTLGPFAYSTHFVHNQRDQRAVRLVQGASDKNLRRLFNRLSAALRDRPSYTREWRRDCFRMLLSMNDVGEPGLMRRLYRAARSVGNAMKKTPAVKPAHSIGDGWRYEVSTPEVIRDGIRGIPSAFVDPKAVMACYRAYKVQNEITVNNSRIHYAKLGDRNGS